MQHDDSIAAVAAFMFVFGAPVLAFIVSRVLRHRERLEMLRRGMMPPEFDKRAYRAWRKSGAPWPPPGGAARSLGPFDSSHRPQFGFPVRRCRGV